MSLKVKNLTKKFGPQKAVDGISFQVSKGEIVGFLGPNGAGKSTAMKVATCYLPPSSGTVEVAGFDVMENPIQVRRQVGYLPEHNPLYLDMYVHEYLGFIGSLHQMKGKELRDRTKKMVDLFGLSREQNKRIGALSKGYRQRVGLAQALIHDPAVLILDEPTTGLDPNQIVEIRDLIKAVSAEKTVIFSTHIMQEVQALCQRAIIINLGKIVADSPVTSLHAGMGATTTTQVAFLEPVDFNKLEAIKGVNKVAAGADNRILVQSDPATDIRPLIFRFAVAEGLTLIELHQEERSLEHIFQQLTLQANA